MNVKRGIEKHPIKSIVFIALAVQISLGALIIYFIDGWSHRGTFGDMFGAVNTLFSGLALGFVAITLRSQQKEFELVRKREHARVQPDFVPKPGAGIFEEGKPFGRRIGLKNRGGQARDIRALSDLLEVEVNPSGFLDRDGEISLNVLHYDKPRSGEFELQFQDELGGESAQRFEFSENTIRRIS